MADCQMHLVRLLLAAYHTYTWMDPGLKVLLDTDTCNMEGYSKFTPSLYCDHFYLSGGVRYGISQAVSFGIVLKLQGILV